ncbi:hypothetical protein [Plantactinospora sp. GCM10030261]|uniref:hypothetical protein n=1 Tax=Plantactinospora sp. GCM10030261 TaxID=3273420 RepID=UPI00360CBED5
MLRIVNEMADRLLGLVVPRATASAADCGYTYQRKDCWKGVERYCTCFTNSNCKCYNCYTTTHVC